jgi:Tfp pilus assembly protein PilO
MKPKEKIYLSLLLFLVSGLILLFFVFSLFKEIRKQSQSLLNLKKNLAEKEMRLINIQNLKLVEKEVSQDLEKTEKIFFDKEAPIDFINFLEKTSQDCEIIVEKISPISSPKTSTPILSRLDFQITGFSNFKGAACFLQKLEFGPYLIQVSNLNLSRITQEELKNKNFQGLSLNDLKLSISFRAYTR